MKSFDNLNNGDIITNSVTGNAYFVINKDKKIAIRCIKYNNEEEWEKNHEGYCVSIPLDNRDFEYEQHLLDLSRNNEDRKEMFVLITFLFMISIFVISLRFVEIALFLILVLVLIMKKEYVKTVLFKIKELVNKYL